MSNYMCILACSYRSSPENASAKMIVTARYMHIWHECIAMTNGKFMVRLKTETEHLCKRGDIEMDSLRNKSFLSLDKIEFRNRLNQFECSKNM